ncbi:MAG TPA: dihydroorotate dehydrogenase (quinone), partial [Patescibacteria group bacterium]|nr:dihydroorotate dehydrogenase (quinone) [Patescibacteria group bacterium]
MKQALVHAVYRSIIKPVCFQFEAERVHEFFLRFGECLGKHPLMRSLAASFCAYKDVSLEQTLHKIPFSNPVGLAAGFDYKASLTEILSALGFGFQTVGTITNGAYEGNEPPRLDRLKRSRSLLVNKGFKNPGIDVILQKLATKKFFAPVGLSIGMTNGRFFGSVSEA